MIDKKYVHTASVYTHLINGGSGILGVYEKLEDAQKAIDEYFNHEGRFTTRTNYFLNHRSPLNTDDTKGCDGMVHQFALNEPPKPYVEYVNWIDPVKKRD